MYNEVKEFKKFTTKVLQDARRYKKSNNIIKVKHHLKQCKTYSRLLKIDGYMVQADKFNAVARDLQIRLNILTIKVSKG